MATALEASFGSSARAQTGPVRRPLSQFAQDAAKLASLRRGVQVMRSRPGTDHRSWFWQGAVHSVSEEIFGEELLRTPGLLEVDMGTFWNQCPHGQQFASADFLIWHRAYLYHFENILRDAAQDPELAVPYWDYTSAGARGFPAVFAPQVYGPQQAPISNSLYHRNREGAFTGGGLSLSEEVGRAEFTRAATQFFSGPGVVGFGGSSTSAQAGRVEGRPHNDVHVAVGGVIGQTNGAMADVPTAAFDPIFWPHHANVDRLWTEWASTPGKSWGPLPPAAWFDQTPWTFKNVDGTDARNSRRYYVDRANLGTRYDTDQPDRPEMALPSGGGPPPPSALSGTAVTLAEAGGLTATPAAPATMILPPTPAPPPSAPGGLRLVLELSQIELDRTPTRGFAVYLTPPTAGRLDERSAYFLGRLDLFTVRHRAVPGRGHAHSASGAQQSFDAGALLPHLGQGRLTLRLVPYDLYQTRNANLPSRPDGVRIGKVALRLQP